MSMREQMNVTASATPFTKKKQFLCMFNYVYGKQGGKDFTQHEA